MTNESLLKKSKASDKISDRILGLSLPKFVVVRNKSKIPVGVVLPEDLLPSDAENKLPAGVALPKKILED